MKKQSLALALRTLFTGLKTRRSRRRRMVDPSQRRPDVPASAQDLEDRLMLTTNLGAARQSDLGDSTLLGQYLDNQTLSGGRDASPEINFEYGYHSSHASANADDTILAGDFSGLGFDQVVAARDFAGAIQWLGDTDRDTTQEYLFRFGLDDMTPLIADMNGDGYDDVIVVDTTTASDLLEWYVHYWDPSGSTDYTSDITLPVSATFSFGVDADAGQAGGGLPDVPHAGDMDGDGRADAIVSRRTGGTWDWYVSTTTAYPNNTSTVIPQDITILGYGSTAAIPIVGDWDNDGDDNIGAVDQTTPLTWNLDTNGGGAAELTPQFGLPGDQVFVGNWADVQWNGNVDSNWSTAGNWSGGALPVNGESVVIDQPSSAAAIAVTTGSHNIGTLHSREALEVSGGTLDIDGGSESSSSVTVNGGTLIAQGSVDFGTFTMSSGTLALEGNNIFGSTPVTVSGGSIEPRSIPRMLNNDIALTGTATVTGSQNLTLSGVLSGSGGLIVNKTGNLTLSGANTYDGVTEVTAGTLILSGSGVAGSTTAGTTVQGGATLQLGLGVTNADAVTLSGNGPWLLGTDGGNSYQTGNVTLAATDVAYIQTGGSLEVAAPISGSVSGQARLVAGGTSTSTGTTEFLSTSGNSYSATTVVESGFLRSGLLAVTYFPGDVIVGDGSGLIAALDVRRSNTIPTSASVTVNADGYLNLDTEVGGAPNPVNLQVTNLTVTGTNYTSPGPDYASQVDTSSADNGGIGTLTVTGSVTINGSADSVVFTGNLALPTTSSGITLAGGAAEPDLTIDGQLIDNAVGTDLVIAGSGMVELLDTSTHTGVTTVAGGANLKVTGSLGTSALTIENGGTFSGTGTTSTVAVESGGTVSPGNSPGVLNTGDFELQSGSSLEIEIGGTSPGNTNSDHDQVNVTGTVTLAGTLNTLQWNGFVPSIGNTFTIINNDGADAVSGTFNGLPEGAVISGFVGSALDAQISYSGGDGNDVVVTAVSTSLVVTTTSDSGAGSLRQAILNANAQPGADTITFNIPAVFPAEIIPATPLPAITEAVIIDGQSQGGASANTLAIGNNAEIEIILDGSTAGGIGLDIDAPNVTVRGLSIINWSGIGIDVSAANAVVSGNFIGVEPDGTTSAANATGVLLSAGADGSVVGGALPAERNLVSGNSDIGISVQSDNITAQGNYIGTNATGDAAIGNINTGISVIDATGTVIGGGASGEGNVIAGSGTAIGISGSSSQTINGQWNTVIQGNIIGLNAAGTAAVPNAEGIFLGNDDNLVGTDGDGINDSAERNIVSGNLGDGISISGNSNVVAGNYIGTNAAGTTALGNQSDGIYVTSSNNMIGGSDAASRNVVSGNGWNGINVQFATAVDNKVQGNYVGLNAAGTTAIANANHGVLVWGGAVGTIIGTDGDGTDDAGESNVISGNTYDEVSFWTDGGNQTVIAGNLIGTTADGLSSLSHSRYGVWVTQGTLNTRIGTNSDGISDELERNIISGGGSDGVRIDVANANTLVAGNYIGTDITGTVDLGNAGSGVWIQNSANNTIGGFATTDRNLISGNDGRGVTINGSEASSNQILGNYIGTDVSGTSAIENSGDGIAVTGAPGNVIGAANAGNLISGNRRVAIYVAGSDSTGNQISANLIGTNAAGTAAIPNAIDVSGAIMFAGAPNNILGTDGDGNNDAAEGNVISGNQSDGVQVFGSTATGNRIAGNRIGTSADGNASIANQYSGIAIFDTGATIIGTNGDGFGDAAEGNLISGNGSAGIYLSGAGTTGTIVAGNQIGTNAAGDAAVANGWVGVAVLKAQGTIVGTNGDGVSDDLEGNLISGNTSDGIYVTGNRTLVENLSISDQLVAGTLPRTVATGTATELDFRDVDGPNGNWTFNNPVPGGGGDDLVIRATGSFDIATTGTYSFSLGGDDGGRLRIDGVDVVVDDTLHGFTEFFGSTTLAAGSHTFEWVGMERRFGASWEVAVKAGVDSTAPATEANGWSILGAASGPAPLSSGTDIDVSVYYSSVLNTSPVTIAGNLIGTTADGSTALGNNTGIFLVDGAQNTRIGTNADGTSDVLERNVVSGNRADGVLIRGTDTDNTIIAGNYLGTDSTGSAAVPNVLRGIHIHSGARETLIGTNGDGVNDASERNVISGNTSFGILIQNIRTDNTVVAGNYIGTNAAGMSGIENASGIRVQNGPFQTRIGTDGDGNGDVSERNVISGNTSDGVAIRNVSQTKVAGNFIGTDVLGTGSVPNGRVPTGGNGAAIWLVGGATDNYIGTDGDGIGDDFEGNLISGNTGYGGVIVANAGTDRNTIAGNLIGTDVTGTVALGNNGYGVELKDSNDSTLVGTNADGVSDALERNVIAGNAAGGIFIWQQFETQPTNATIAGNYIGTNITGDAAITGGGQGVVVVNAAGLLVGSDGDGVRDDVERNVISGFGDFGIGIADDGATVRGNYIGTDAAGTTSIGNRIGVGIYDGIGGSLVTDNVISGNTSHGVLVEDTVVEDIASGRISAWNADGDATDSVGSNDASIGSLVTFEPGIYGGQAFRITGSFGNGPTVQAPDDPSFDQIAANDHVTMAAWVQWDGLSASATGYTELPIINRAIPVAPWSHFHLALSADGRPWMRVTDGVNPNQLNSGVGNELTPNEWTHVAGTYDGSTFRLYVNGEEIAQRSATVDIMPSNAPVNIGSSGYWRFGGLVDEANLYDRALTQSEIQELAGPALTEANRIQGNVIGLIPDGTAPLGNAGDGISVVTNTSLVTIGTDSDGLDDIAERNLISGNLDNGIALDASANVTISGNYIGTDAAGSSVLGNSTNGILIDNSANVLIGTDGDGVNDAAERNVISGNASGTNANVNMIGAGSTDNIVAGNYIGTDSTGTVALTNAGRGVRLAVGATFNTIGTDGSNDAFNANERNIISGHSEIAVFVVGGSNDNIVAGNWVGLDATGTINLGNATEGISLDGVARTRVGTNADGIADAAEANVVAGAGRFGVLIANGAADNTFAGSKVGTDSTGTIALPNAEAGIVVAHNATSNTIGGTASAAGNLVSGNVGPGIWLLREYNSVAYSPSPGNVVQGNRIGTDVTGSFAIGNTGAGVLVEEPDTTIGGNVSGAGNLISGNSDAGVLVTGVSASNSIIAGNLIGTNAAGSGGIGNELGVSIVAGAANTLVGGSTSAARNVISGNQEYGVSVVQPGAGTKIQGNFVGTDVSGTQPIANGFITSNRGGILVSSIDSNPVTIGVDGDGSNDATEGNVISGNAGYGIRLQAGNASNGGNVVAGNNIGVDVSGTFAVPNNGSGVLVLTPDNIIGSNLDGTSDALEGNVIGGNAADGIFVFDNSQNSGTPADGFTADNTTIAGNFIGTDATATLNLGNDLHGIRILHAANTLIGGTAPSAANVIAYNTEDGVVLGGVAENLLTTAEATTAQQNVFFGNGGTGIDIGGDGITLNDDSAGISHDGILNFPVITDATVDAVNSEFRFEGFVTAGSTIELYISHTQPGDFGQGQIYLGTFVEGSIDDKDSGTSAYGPDVDGVTVATGTITENNFRFTIPLPSGVSDGTRLTALATGSVSEFGPVVIAGDQVTAIAPSITLTPTAVAVQTGEEIRINGTFFDPDSTSWTGTVDYGDGTTAGLVLNPDNTFELRHTYVSDGDYTVLVSITDNSLASGSANAAVNVTNETPQATFNSFTITSPADEGEVVTLTGEFSDAGLGDTHSVDIDWGDGSIDTNVPVSSGSRTFTATHIYADDSNPDDSPSATDVYRVQVTISDQSGASDSTPLGLFLEEINNVRPANLSASFSSTSVVEGQTVTITSGAFTDPGVLDTHTVRINWGDGSPAETIDLAANVLSFSGQTHTYVDDPADGPDEYIVTIEVVDDDEPNTPTILTQTITVTNHLPENLNVVLSPDPVDEGTAVSLSASFIDSGIEDAHRAVIDWGDGSLNTIDLPAGTTFFDATTHPHASHTYADNAPTPAGYPVTVSIIDFDDPASPGVGTATANVANAAPTIVGVSIDAGGTMFAEGDTIAITGSYEDLSPQDTHTVVVDWGDGSVPSLATVDSGTRTFTATHTFIDNGQLTGFDADIVVTVTDVDGDSSNASQRVNIANLNPLAAINPVEGNADPNLIPLEALVDDPGLADVPELTYHWEAQALPAGTSSVQTGTVRDFTVDRSLHPSAIWEVRLTVEDLDGGSRTKITSLLVGSASAETITVDDSTFAGLATDSSLTVLGLAGQDILDASGVTDPTRSVVLDGGDDTDLLYGGAGDDVFFLRSGNDAAGVTSANIGNFPALQAELSESITLGGGVGGIALPEPHSIQAAGNDRFFLTPNSNLTVIDQTGDNALDFTLASFGVTFDLAATRGTTPIQQDVAPTGTQPNHHFVTAQGSFGELVGSTYADTLTAASNSKVLGGVGNDKLKVTGNTTGASLSGGADDDILEVTGTDIDDLTFGGDAGIDILLNMGEIDDLTFNGGADDDIFINNGSESTLLHFGGDEDILLAGVGSIGVLTFGGDDGADLFVNLGDVTELNFNGGADNDIFINSGSEATTLNFGGDEDVLLAGEGTIGMLNFGGDEGVDLFANTGSVTELHFSGGADDDIFINNGTESTMLSFEGDEDILLAGEGSVGTLTFGGDDGADLFVNLGDVTELAFNGGADDDIFINNGSESTMLSFGGDEDILLAGEGSVGTLTFGGDDGADILVNLGDVTDLTFNGGADDDIFINSGTEETTLNFGGDEDVLLAGEGSIGMLNFGGDEGLDTLINVGVVTDLTFGGGADGDIFINEGTILGSLNFGGDDDILISTGGKVALEFNGDVGADTLVNKGTVWGDLTFGGGADDDILQNEGVIIGELNFSGDAGLDILENSGEISGSLIFGGDAGLDVLANGGNIASLVFEGGADDDIFVNGGEEPLSLNFGGDDNILLSSPGTIGDLFFNGDDGVDTLLNFGEVTDLIFTGGADNDLLINEGTVIGGLNFGGDDGIDVLRNNGTVDELIFGGGADDDIFINEGTVEGTLNFGGDDDILISTGGEVTLDFNGDAGADLLVNVGTVSGNLIFGGGADDDVLRNEGFVGGELNFGGDIGDDLLVNSGAVTTLIFTGGADDDTLVNTGSDITLLSFGGDSGLDSLLNTGSHIGTLIFTGGADDDILQNEGTDIGLLSFGGDVGDDILLNEGTVGELVFGGGADDDWLINEGNEIGSLSFGGDIDNNGEIIPGTNAGDDTLIIRGSGAGDGVAKVVFHGDDGIDAFQNNATGFLSLTFEGGADDDVFENTADNISLLTFNGDLGEDVFVNNGAGVTVLEFNGDFGDDIFVNDGADVAELTFMGGADDDLLINNGNEASRLLFIGDVGIDRFINTGANVLDLTFSGGDDDDVFVNAGPMLSGLNFTGDAGIDTFLNRSVAIGSTNLIFTGGADDDLLINDAAEVGRLVFNGDEGADGFQNNGFDAVDLVFNGGADDDLFINTGNSPDSLTFNGGADDDILQVSGAEIGVLNFDGDIGDDSFFTSGEVQMLTFTGGADDDILQVLGGEVETLSFSGDAGEDILVSNGEVASLEFFGGADDDILQSNGPEVLALRFEGGADDDTLINNSASVVDLEFIGDIGVDTLISNGASVGTLDFTGDDGPDSLRIQAGSVSTLTFNGGADNDTFSYNGESGAGSQMTFDAGPGNDLVSWRGSANSFKFLGGTGVDTGFIIGSGNLLFDGGAGDDTVKVVGNPIASLTVKDLFVGATDNSSDTLDFSSFTGGALDLDLRSTAPQSQSSTFTVTITDGMGVENTIGTPFSDTINGNARNNILAGADFADSFSDSDPIASVRTETQWVLLDFDTHTNTNLRPDGTLESGEYEYSQDERDQIEANVQGVYRGPDMGAPWFDVRVTQVAADIPAGTDYATIYFNQTPDFGRPGGLASEIDLGNQNLGGSAQVQINGLLGGIITAKDVEGSGVPGPGEGNSHDHGHSHGAGGANSFKGDHAVISDAEVGALKPAASSENFVALSSKVAAHELGHLLGLRHADSFGPIGFGLHDPPGGGAYKPVYTGPSGGFETFDHILGSPASVGSTRFDDLNELFFGEREAVKLAYSFSDPEAVNKAESTTLHATQATAQPLVLTTVAVPNTLSRGLNASKDFFVQMVGVNGSIELNGTSSENDWYKFTGVAGELVNIDVMSNSLARFGSGPDDFVDTVVRVYNGSGDLVPYYGGFAVNDDIFEPTDSSIIDLVLPADDTYFVEVDTFRREANDPLSDPSNPDSPLNVNHPANPANLDPLDPDYQARLDIYKRFIDSVSDTDLGNYQLFLFRYRDANASDDIDNIKGNGGDDELNGGPNDDYTTSFVAGQTGIQEQIDEGGRLIRKIEFNDRGAVSWSGSTVDYGDGTLRDLAANEIEGEPLSFSLDHTYTDSGTFTVTVTLRNDLNRVVVHTFTVESANLAPTAMMTNDGAIFEAGTARVNLNGGTDASIDDVTDGLRYSFALDANDLLLSYVDSSDEFSEQFTFTDNGTYVVHGRVIDKDGSYTDYTTSVVVNTVAPTATPGNNGPVVEGSPVTVSLANATDVSSSDRDAGLRYSFALNTSALNADYNTSSEVSEAPFSFTDDGQFTVYARVIDKDNDYTDYPVTVTVNNVAPTASIGNNGPVDEASPATISLTSPVDPSSDDIAAGLRYSFAVTSAGLAANYASAGSANTTDFAFPDNGNYTVYARIIDWDGGFTDYTTNVVVENVAPTASLSGPIEGTTNSQYTINLSASDVAGVADPLTVNWTITLDGAQLDTQAGGNSYVYTPTDPGEYVFSATVDDGDMGVVTVTYSQNIAPDNQAPVVTIAGRDSGVRGQTLTYTFAATDSDVQDQNENFIWTIDWGDGSSIETVVSSDTLTLTHVFNVISDGTDFNVTATAEDVRGLGSTATIKQVEILRWEVQDDPLYPGETVLMVGGSTGDDRIRIRQGHHNDFIKLKINEVENEVQIRANAGDMVDRLAIYGHDGNDRIQVSLNVSLPALLDGGAGDDKLIGGYGTTILVGQDGDDTLFGSYKRGILIGGRGKDKLYGWDSSDLLIAGYTSFDNDRAALDAIASEWTSNRNYYHRICNLKGSGWGSRANGNYLLKFNQSDPADDTVHDDEEVDKLWGGHNLDWYIGNTDGDDEGARDRLFGVKWYEVVTDLDRV